MEMSAPVKRKMDFAILHSTKFATHLTEHLAIISSHLLTAGTTERFK